MTALIHPTAVIDNKAKIHPTVRIDPYAVIGSRVSIGANTGVGSHAIIDGLTTVKIIRFFLVQLLAWNLKILNTEGQTVG